MSLTPKVADLQDAEKWYAAHPELKDSRRELERIRWLMGKLSASAAKKDMKQYEEETGIKLQASATKKRGSSWSETDREALRKYEETFRNVPVTMTQSGALIPAEVEGTETEPYYSESALNRDERKELENVLDKAEFSRFIDEYVGTLPSQPSEEDLRKLEEGAAALKYSVRHAFYTGQGVVVTRDADSSGGPHTVCITRPMRTSIVGGPEPKSYDLMAPEKCFTFTPSEKRCVEETDILTKEKTECSPVEQVFACAQQTLSPTIAAVLAGLSLDSSNKCILNLEKAGALYEADKPSRMKYAEDKALGEKIYSMDRGTSSIVKSGLPIKTS